MTDTVIAPPGAPALTPDAGPWTDRLDGPLTCTSISRVTHDVTSFRFAAAGAARLRFLPGQYLTLRLDLGGRRVERCYTISSSPLRPDELEITVKRVPGGEVSPWLHDRLRVGDVVEAAGPLGCFSWAHHPAQRHLLLTAGSGITPAMSMLREEVDAGAWSDVVLVHCARSPADVPFRAELGDLAARGIRVVVLCEDDSPHERWTGPRGRLDLAALHAAAPDLLEREVFTCGPPPFMDAVRGLLEHSGADPGRCHEESFVLGSRPAPATAPSGPGAGPAAGDPTTCSLLFRRSGRVVTTDAATTVLDAAATAGVVLPSSCGEGVCGTCKLGLLSGEVDMQHAGGIRPREVERGLFLPCCSTPLGDLEIDA